MVGLALGYRKHLEIDFLNVHDHEINYMLVVALTYHCVSPAANPRDDKVP
jgi:hypothetical protein